MSDLGVIALLVLPIVLGGGLWWFLRRKQEPPSNEMLLSHTFTHILEGDHTGVLDRMRRLYEQTGHDVGIGLALGNLLRSLGKNKVAIRTHRSLTTRGELPAEVTALIHTELAADYLASGLLSRAKESLEQALELHKPDEVTARYGEEIYERLGEFNAVAKLLAAWGKNGGKDSGHRIALLRCRQAEKAWEEDNLKEANDSLKKAFSADEDCLPAYLLNSRMLRESGKPDKARAYLDKHLERFAGKEWLVVEEWKNIAMADSQISLFLDAVERHLQKEPEDWRTRAVLGNFLFDTGEYEQAADALLAALDAAPHVLKLHQNMWSLMMRMGEMDVLERYRAQVKEDLVFSKPYRCKGCSYDSEKLVWRCPSCHRIYSFSERNI